MVVEVLSFALPTPAAAIIGLARTSADGLVNVKLDEVNWTVYCIV
jgi:hypothetical protein